ncbi:MAG: tRNA (guanosine(37)-N1)-methyltransferase TrmD [Eubacteriales bacterium]|nr:tRNA (guanosine(37)-N1)-methyltransferase TrmD [Eubacteriales bacterium]
MRFSTLSLFPEIIRASTDESMGLKAQMQGLAEIVHAQIRERAINAYGKVDDALYGGGTGMLLMAEPIYQTIQDLKASFRSDHPELLEPQEQVIYMSPRGQVLNQTMAYDLAQFDHLIILAGHYEGVDQRLLEEVGAREISVGDYVLTGGELPAAVLIDVVIRMLDRVLPDPKAWQAESHASGLLEEDQYTRPELWRGRRVPAVLLSGHDAKIQAYRKASALYNTLKSRPDLLAAYPVSEEEWQDLLDFMSSSS